MIKSLKGQLILSVFVAICFIYINLSSVEFVANKGDPTVRIIFFFIMVLTVFNAGLLTEKYIQVRKKKKQHFE